VKTFNRLGLAIVCAAALSAIGAVSSMADTIYTYTGMDFTTVSGSYTTSDYVSGIIDLANPIGADAFGVTLSPVSFSFTDGVQTLTNLSSLVSASFIDFSTNASGIPTAWEVHLVKSFSVPIDIYTASSPPLLVAVDDVNSGPYGYVQGSPGTWSVAETPLPAALPLFASGLGALGLLGWRRKRKNAAA
jgi:hypothetical protein